MADWMGMEDIPTGAVEWNAVHNANRALIAALLMGALKEQSITYGAAITIDCSLGGVAHVTLTGNCTVTLTNLADGQVFRLYIVQGGSGGYAVTSWTGVTKWQGGSAPTLTATVGHEDVIEIVKHGSVVLGSAKLNFY
jgi:hypothetical protein